MKIRMTVRQAANNCSTVTPPNRDISLEIGCRRAHLSEAPISSAASTALINRSWSASFAPLFTSASSYTNPVAASSANMLPREHAGQYELWAITRPRATDRTPVASTEAPCPNTSTLQIAPLRHGARAHRRTQATQTIKPRWQVNGYVKLIRQRHD